jgi:hypothetical protein
MKILDLQNKTAANRIGTFIISVFLVISVLGCSVIERFTKSNSVANNTSACEYLEDEGIKATTRMRNCLFIAKLEENGKLTMIGSDESMKNPPAVRVAYQVSEYNIEITFSDNTKNPDVEKRFLELAEKISQKALGTSIPAEVGKLSKEEEMKPDYAAKAYFKKWSTNGKKINGNDTRAEISKQDYGKGTRMNFHIYIAAKPPY